MHGSVLQAMVCPGVVAYQHMLSVHMACNGQRVDGLQFKVLTWHTTPDALRAVPDGN